MSFDATIDRNAVPTMKWGRSYLAQHFGNEDAIPMSVADMDLPSPPNVAERMAARVEHGIYGYGTKPDRYFAAIEDWFRTRHEWGLDRAELQAVPSILAAVAILIEQHSEPGDGVVVQPPVFFDFKSTIRRTGRTLVKNPLRLVDGRYEMDFDDLEAKAAVPTNRVLILCNPHNPVGRVWTREELAQVAEICARHGVFVIADEIHGDFAFPPHHYTPYLSLSDEAADGAAACLSPAKTFNVAGIVDAFVAIPNAERRDALRTFVRRYHMTSTNVFATEAIEAAYRHGAAWLDDAVAYVHGNVELVRHALHEADLGVSIVQPEGTYLLWLDFRALGMDAKVLERFLGRRAGIALSQGYWFGREGAGFARMTVACPRSTVQIALERLSDGVRSLA